MTTSTVFTAAEFTAFAADGVEASRLAKAHGYTINGVAGAGVMHRHIGASAEDFVIEIDQADDKATITANLTAATAATSLSAAVPSQTTTANALDTTTYDLNGEPNAVVNLKWFGCLAIDKNTLTLDGAGDGSFVVGPFALGTCTDADGIEISCVYEDQVADGCVCIVKVAP